MAETHINRQILLVSRPQGEASVSNFKLVETPLAPLQDGGPFGALCGAIAGAVIAGLAGAAAGCATGAALGETLDQKVLGNWHCHGCGHTFTIRPN